MLHSKVLEVSSLSLFSDCLSDNHKVEVMARCMLESGAPASARNMQCREVTNYTNNKLHLLDSKRKVSSTQEVKVIFVLYITIPCIKHWV